MAVDELYEHLESLKRDECYRVDSVLKKSDRETTEKVYFVGANGAEQGPYIRKYLESDHGLGKAYRSILLAQKAGRRFKHLPTVYDVYRMEDTDAVVMEFVPGETLQEVVYRCDPSMRLAADVFPRLCDAAIELHEGFEQPLIHRDIKPSNIVITRDSLTIIDFGISRTYKDGSEADTGFFGTRAYAPPEQFGYGQTDVRTDVYALGAVLYFCLSEKHLDRQTVQGGFAAMDLPDEMRAVLAKATAFDPASRYPSVRELRSAFLDAVPQDLRAAQEGRRVEAPRPTLQEGPDDVYVAPGKASEGGGRHSRMPQGLGIAWDTVLLLAFILVFYVATTLVFWPEASASAVDRPLAARFVGYYGVVCLLLGPALYLAADKRPLRKAVPALQRTSRRRELLACIIVMVAGFFVVGLSQYLP